MRVCAARVRAGVCWHVCACLHTCARLVIIFCRLEHSDQVDEELGNIEVEEVIKVDRETLVTEYIVSYWLLVEALKIVLTDSTASGLVNGRNEVVQLHCPCLFFSLLLPLLSWCG